MRRVADMRAVMAAVALVALLAAAGCDGGRNDAGTRGRPFPAGPGLAVADIEAAVESTGGNTGAVEIEVYQ